MPPLLSICMIAKNEEQNLRRALASVAPLSAELIVVDTGSTDQTVSVAKEHGARVFESPWVDDFAHARNVSLEKATGTWLLLLDADEVVTPEFCERVTETLAAATAGGVRVPVLNVNAEGQLLQRTWGTRLVRNGCGYLYEGRVHEDIELPILKLGGTLGRADLPIVHHGYTAAESRRKGRSERNMKLLRAEHEAHPLEPRHWHYLGLELAIEGHIAEASEWFERVIREHPTHRLAGWSASQLAAIRRSERAFGAAWDAAVFGMSASLGRAACHVHLAELALREEDAPTLRAVADALASLTHDDDGDVDEWAPRVAAFRAAAVEIEGDPKKAFAMLASAAGAWPESVYVAERLVRTAERIYSHAGKAAERALTVASTPAVLASSVGAFVRARAFAAAVQLGEEHGIISEYVAYALLLQGQEHAAEEVLAKMGEGAALHWVLHGLARGEHGTGALERGLPQCPPAYASVARRVARAKRVAPREEGILNDWLAAAVAFRADDLAERLASCLPMPDNEQRGRLALMYLEVDDIMRALALAEGAVNAAEGNELVGRLASHKGDHGAAAQLLSQRVHEGDAPVSVVAAACLALQRLGKKVEARAVLEAGRASRPHSRFLALLASASRA